MQYIILTPQQLIERLDKIHPTAKSLQTYLWVTSDHKCWETRGLNKKQTDDLIFQGEKIPQERDFSQHLNNWDAIFSQWT
ncbi:ribosomal protein L15E [Oceanisphaera litoralis]|uniref:hypothetical protein n=1 Tax=Oceanisphaera litoralis TaxID=225144 RepID=UPI00195BC948|nr:hypothetical protein [Oceanisphaera litoralis]MBM7457246.1 ribosomal protein L15E [Oceanisphaera litoralis]